MEKRVLIMHIVLFSYSNYTKVSQLIDCWCSEDYMLHLTCGNLCAVSQFAVEEYEALQDMLDLERDLRTEAESFGRAVSFDTLAFHVPHLFFAWWFLICSFVPWAAQWCSG